MITTIDNYLLTLAKRGFDNLNNISQRDVKVLNSLTRQLTSNVFLTENQARLLLKILNENRSNLPEIPDAVVWSQEFRQLDQVRNISWDKTDNTILIEISFSKRVKQIIMDLKDSLDGSLYTDTPGKRFKVDLTEKNLHTVVSMLRGESFVIEPGLLEYFKDIDALLKERKTALNDINVKTVGLVSNSVDFTNPLIAADRRIRYQYSAPDATGNSLAVKLANRKHRKVFSSVNFDNLVSSLVELDRKKILVVLDSFDSSKSLHAIKEIQSALEVLEGESRPVGIYFRFDNHSNSNKEFNEFIKSRRLNAPLTKTSFIAGIASNQIPKFIFKEGWYPDTVISFVTNMHNNKVSAFCDSVDMIIYYTNNKPIHSSGEIDEIV